MSSIGQSLIIQPISTVKMQVHATLSIIIINVSPFFGGVASMSTCTFTRDEKSQTLRLCISAQFVVRQPTVLYQINAFKRSQNFERTTSEKETCMTWHATFAS